MKADKTENIFNRSLGKVLIFTIAALAVFLPLLTRAADPNEFLVWSNTVPGRLYVPVNYTPTKSYPLVIFYHGIGEKGTNNTSQVNSNINNLLAACKQREVFLYAPQSAGGWWPDSEIGKVMEMVRTALATYNIDDKRVYVTGLSAGGSGVYNTMEVHYNSIAAAVCICGAGGGERARDNKLVGKPMWFFHAANDPTVSVGQTRNAINGIRAEDGRSKLTFPLDANPANPYYNTGSPYYTDGSTFFEEANIRYTEYDLGGHGIWGRVYNETWMYDWLFSHSLPTSPVNRAPDVNVGVDRKLILPMNILSINAAYLDDGLPHPPVLTKKWTQVSGPAAVTFANSTSPATTATFSIAGTYVLRCTVSDGELSGSDDLTVTVKPPMPDGQIYVISPLSAGGASGSAYFPLQDAFDLQPDWDAVNQTPVSGGGNYAPSYTSRQGYIDFGPDWANIRITAAWTKYRSSTSGNQSGYAALWWDDDKDNINDNGIVENILNFNSAQNVTSSSSELWIRDADCSASPITPKGRYLIISSPATTTSRAIEYAFVGYMQTGSPVNAAPAVNAGTDQTITLPASANLNGTVTDDGLPTSSVTTQWTKVSGPGTVTFANSAAVDTTAGFAVAGTYVLRLTANDSALQTSDDVSITVNPEPVIYYTLTVNSGSGDGDYTAGSVVPITADQAPAGQEFDVWIGNVANLANSASASTTVTIPTTDVIVTASYKNIPPVDGLDITQEGDIIATVTAPLGGGNHDINIIRDGDKPEEGNTDSKRQYDTYDRNAAPFEEYIGYTYNQTFKFSQIVFQEGKHFYDGGFFANGAPRVQVRKNGTWNDVVTVIDKPYPIGNDRSEFGTSYETYTFFLNDEEGDGIRLIGQAGGTAHFISVGELEVFQAPATENKTVMIDFGDAGKLTAGNWNNLAGDPAAANGAISDLIDSDGENTGINVQVTDAIASFNSSGTTTPDAALGYEANATRDSFWGNDKIYAGKTEPTAEFVLTGLDPAKKYTLTFFASRMGVNDNRETEYTVNGLNSAVLYLDPANNIDKEVSTAPVTPDANGEISIGLKKGPNNTNGYGFYYIGVLKINF